MESLPRPSSARGARTSGARILVIDDELDIIRGVRDLLLGEGYQVESALTAVEGIAKVARWKPDVVVLDRCLPGVDGLEVCQRIRAQHPGVPVIILSVIHDGADRADSLRAGAYDHVTKPFHPEELIERIKVGLGYLAGPRGHAGAGPYFRSGDLVIDFDRRRVSKVGREIHVTRTEFELLKYLAQNADRPVRHELLLRQVWGSGYEDAETSLRVAVYKIRQKLEDDPNRPRLLLTIRDVGYSLAVLPATPTE